MADTNTVVLGEGESDRLAIEAAAIRCRVDLHGAGVEVVAMGGATNIGRYLTMYGPGGRNLRLAGLCDAGELRLFTRQLERAGLTSDGFFVCERDLEVELIRALGTQSVEEIIEREGELASLRTLQQMPHHRDGTMSEHLHRFIGSKSGRKHRYATLLASALDADKMPRPLRELLAYVSERSRA